jgi:hexokinase
VSSPERAALIRARLEHIAAPLTSAAFAADAIAAAAVKADTVTKVANGVFNTVIEIYSTFGDIVRGAMSALVGKASNFTTGTLVFKSLDGSKTRWTVTTNETGRLTSTTGDLT